MPVDLSELAAATSNPERAHTALQRLADTSPAALDRLGDVELGRLAVVAAVCAPLVDAAARHERVADALSGDLGPLDAPTIHQRCAAAMAEAPSPARALAVEQRAGLLRITVRDLLGLADTPTVAAELADLAQGVLSAALAHACRDRDVAISLIGMGKLGGRELNYVSDVDVIFVAEGDYADAAAAAGDFMRLMAEVTPDGRAYEVDANLRPEGKDGPLVRSLDAYRSYYDRWAKTWEFQALLKARVVAGDADLGAAFTELIEPYVWPDRLDPEAVGEIQRMKTVVEKSTPVQRAGARQVKLAPGGLRDIEFAVQLLQLVHGRHDRALRSPNTLEALAALARGAYVGEEDGAEFRNAYVFLRTVEHRLQMANLRRTHTVPSNDDDRRRLARTVAAHLSPEGGKQPGDLLHRFDSELARTQGEVRRLHEKLFYRPLLARFAALSSAEQIAVAGQTEETGLAADAAKERLVALGFARPQEALRHLEALAGGVSRRAHLLRTVLPAILPTLAAAPDPDAGLAALRSLAESTQESPYLMRTLRDHPPVADMLARVLGASAVVGRWLERQPEVLGLLADATGLERELLAEDYARLAEGLRRRSQGSDIPAALRRMRRREAARTAVRDLAGLADVVAVGHELTGLAEACLQAAVNHVVPDGVRMSVIAMGKLGGRELGYASDLDVLIVTETTHDDADGEQAAERLLEVLSGVTPEGQAFRVDLNLRPEGKDGPLSRSLSSYRSYYERWAETWELQALTQARPVAGDPELGAAFLEMVNHFVYPMRAPAQRLADVRKMKARVERERAGVSTGIRARTRGARPAAPTGKLGGRARTPPLRVGTKTDLKLGAGGLSDVEWTVQLLQLQHGGAQQRLRVPGALAGVEACVEAGLLDGQEGRWLADGWRLLTRLRNARYLAGARDTHLMPADPVKLERLARMLGYERPGAQRMSEDLARAMRRVRRVHERAFYDAPTR